MYNIALGNNLSISNEREHRNSRQHHWCLSFTFEKVNHVQMRQIWSDLKECYICGFINRPGEWLYCTGGRFQGLQKSMTKICSVRLGVSKRASYDIL